MSDEKQFQDFRKEVEKLKEIDGAEEYAKQLAHLFLGNGLSLQTILLMAIDYGQQHPQWIPVEEELPPKEEAAPNVSVDVIVTDGKSCYTSYYNFRLKMWRWNENATHWMPLPQAPRKEE